MPLAQDDRRFVTGLAVVVGLLVACELAVRRPLRAAAAEQQAAIGTLRRKLAGEPPPRGSAGAGLEAEQARELAARGEQLVELEKAIAFDPGPLLDPNDHDSDPTDRPALYVKLSRSLHENIRAAVERQPQPVHVPRVFDPQGTIQRPIAIRVAPLHRQLTAAYEILRAAIAARVDIVDIRSVRPAGERPAAAPYLAAAHTTVKARGSLDALAAFLHAVSRAPTAGRAPRFLSVEHLHVAPDPAAPGTLGATITFAAIRVNRAAALAEQ